MTKLTRELPQLVGCRESKRVVIALAAFRRPPQPSEILVTDHLSSTRCDLERILFLHPQKLLFCESGINLLD